MKSLTRIVCLLGILSILFSRPVALEKATAVALNKFPNKTIEKIDPISDDLYLTTFKNGGFVLGSADDGFPAILAYSDKTPAYGTNPAFQAMCDQYSKEIEAVKSQDRAIHPDWNTSEPGSLNKPLAMVEPMISSKWNQSPHYNHDFPYFKIPGYTSTSPYVGCVAVVMGQLMNYYEHPGRGFGKRWYFSPTIDSTLHANFDTTWYDYENMPDSLHNEYGTLIASDDQVRDIALFLYQCAVSVEMDFQPEGSSAAYEDMMYALTSHFDYGTEMVQELKSDHDDNTWKQMIVAELNAGRPVPYRGNGDDGGHAFLLDGYETTTNTYFHFNWGWGGQLDGWFQLSALNPADGYDYTDNQAAVFNIQPNDDDITRYAYTGFEGPQAGWHYDGSFYTVSGEEDLVYGFDQNDQWLISPKIQIPNNNNATFMVYAASDLSGARECQIMLSFTDTSRSSFTTEIGRISPGAGWTAEAFTLRPYKNSVAYIGIRYLSSNGYIILDDLSVWTPKVVISTKDIMPETHELLNIYPNPFNPRTALSYRLSTVSDVQINIFDLKGNNVLTLLDDAQDAGEYKLTWDASGFPSGLYICSLTVNNKLIESQKMLLVK